LKRKLKPRLRTFRIQNPVWQYVLFVRAGGTRDEAERWFRRQFGEPPEVSSDGQLWATSAMTFSRRTEKSHLIWFESLKPDGAIVAHEAVHSVTHALQASGLAPLTEQTEEAYAYLVQWTVKVIGDRLW
jgi:hypothetical protein